MGNHTPTNMDRGHKYYVCNQNVKKRIKNKQTNKHKKPKKFLMNQETNKVQITTRLKQNNTVFIVNNFDQIENKFKN